MALLKGGRLVLPDPGLTTAVQLIQSMRDQVWSVTVNQGAFVEMRRRYLISHVERQPGRVQLRILSSERPHPDAVPVEPTLKDAYAYHML